MLFSRDNSKIEWQNKVLLLISIFITKMIAHLNFNINYLLSSCDLNMLYRQSSLQIFVTNKIKQTSSN